MLTENKKDKLYLKYTEENSIKFYYVKLGLTFCLWTYHNFVNFEKINNKLVPYIEFPVNNAKIEKGKKEKSLILKPDEEHWVAHLFIRCGYKGKSKIKLDDDEFPNFIYKYYHSLNGKLGISEGILIQIPKEISTILINWKRTGKLKGNLQPFGTTLIDLEDGIRL
jgi:hypothetical protein